MIERFIESLRLFLTYVKGASVNYYDPSGEKKIFQKLKLFL